MGMKKRALESLIDMAVTGALSDLDRYGNGKN